jgi:hypothetical protein
MADPNSASLILIGRDFEVSGRVQQGIFQRLSDFLNQQRAMVILEQAEIESGVPFVGRADDIAVRSSEILFAVPLEEKPPTNDAVDRVIPKARTRALMLVADWILEGNLHISADGTVERFLTAGTQEFIPVTDCALSRRSGENRSLPLILVSRSHLTLIVGAHAG